ncbi:hypothetical protein DMC47_01500 [Nostoc sp. 3335mG]|nr:hypothetical protein DMC47_01500 [Nostoc sp. 3335mG]
MLLRLLLALLIALPMPAMASCHDAPQPEMQMMDDMAGMHAIADHGDHAPSKPEPIKQMPAEGLCIGCVAPATIRPAIMAAPLRHALILDAPRRVTGDTIAAPAPDTPPPRSEA